MQKSKQTLEDLLKEKKDILDAIEYSLFGHVLCLCPAPYISEEDIWTFPISILDIAAELNEQYGDFNYRVELLQDGKPFDILVFKSTDCLKAEDEKNISSILIGKTEYSHKKARVFIEGRSINIRYIIIKDFDSIHRYYKEVKSGYRLI